MKRNPWTREELVLALRLYWQLPFGRLHQGAPEIIALAGVLGRTAGAVAMKLNNFASLDPELQARGIVGLKGASVQDRIIFEKYLNHNETLVTDADPIAAKLHLPELDEEVTDELIPPSGPTETLRQTKVRKVQAFFRRVVIASYVEACGICRLNIKPLLQASHIIPWSDDESRRADPTNGIALCVLHDKAFDRGLLTFDAKLRIVLSPKVRKANPVPLHQVALLDIEGQKLFLPERFSPDPLALKYHRRMHKFEGG